MRNIVMNFNEYINENMVDTILDKISKSGMDSLTKYEKDILDKSSKNKYSFDSVEDKAKDWLKKYNNLRIEKFVHRGIGNIITTGYIFLDDDLDVIMKLEEIIGLRISNTLYIDSIIWDKLSEFELDDKTIENILKEWLSDNYKETNWKKIKLSIQL